MIPARPFAFQHFRISAFQDFRISAFQLFSFSAFQDSHSSAPKGLRIPAQGNTLGPQPEKEPALVPRGAPNQAPQPMPCKRLDRAKARSPKNVAGASRSHSPPAAAKPEHTANQEPRRWQKNEGRRMDVR